MRWYIVALLALASELNYLDRQALSVLAQTIQDELGFTTIEYSYITSAFLASYTVMYLVSGRLVDWLGSRKSFSIFVTGWSIATILHFFARSPFHFAACRFLLGATEPANFPAGVKAVSEWFPMRERALAVGLFNAGTAIGAGLAAPVVSVIALTLGWRWAFVITGGLGFLWVIVWHFAYRLPPEHPRLSDEEKTLILDGRAAGAPPVPMLAWSKILRMRATWACVFARMLTDPVTYLFVFWTPKYLQEVQGFDLKDIGKFSWIPFVALALGNIAGGLVPNRLVRLGWTVNRARMSVMLLASLAMPVLCFSITRATVPAIALTCISLAMFCHAAWANMTLPAEILPSNAIGSVTGLAGALGGVMGIVTQTAIGWTVQNLSFTPVFAVAAFMHLSALIGVKLLIGKISQRPPEADAPTSA
ncbi:MFS transporter [Oleiharenicola lentus]|uniref:MFS transporter n=1 Tax=Oleiharenicola lentus TaxID=2508720 RepID=UPI001C5519E2|nr:MFS transporter [Oleiharenicola lentus]